MAPSLPRRRSTLVPRLQALGAVFEPFGEDSSLVERLRHKASDLVLCDLSPLTRIGVKGEVGGLLKRSALVVPKAVNESAVQKDGSLCLRLAQREVLLLSALASDGTRDFAALHKSFGKSFGKSFDKSFGKNFSESRLDSRRTTQSKKVFFVPYQDSLCWLALAGERASDLLATMCAVDLRNGAFAHGNVAQTSLARLSALVLRDPASTRGGAPLFHLLADNASSLYLWDCLLDAMAGLDGVVCGRQDLLRFLARPPSSRKRRPPL